MLSTMTRSCTLYVHAHLLSVHSTESLADTPPSEGARRVGARTVAQHFALFFSREVSSWISGHGARPKSTQSARLDFPEKSEHTFWVEAQTRSSGDFTKRPPERYKQRAWGGKGKNNDIRGGQRRAVRLGACRKTRICATKKYVYKPYKLQNHSNVSGSPGVRMQMTNNGLATKRTKLNTSHKCLELI